jgi:hypothetical protein
MSEPVSTLSTSTAASGDTAMLPVISYDLEAAGELKAALSSANAPLGVRSKPTTIVTSTLLRLSCLEDCSCEEGEQQHVACQHSQCIRWKNRFGGYETANQQHTAILPARRHSRESSNQALPRRSLNKSKSTLCLKTSEMVTSEVGIYFYSNALIC